MLAYEVDS
jgi:glutathione S-transferase